MMGRIVTFYSYKGGVGRSMALANIAILLARRGLKVLAIDWDLEAPGLDRYFDTLKMDTNGAGLLQLMIDHRDTGFPDYTDYLWKVIDQNENNSFSFLHSGHESDNDYAKNLDNFDWRAFFSENNGGAFIEELRNKWREDFDVVLIDSRTGLTDSGGICTIQLPDIVVPMFTANHQSLYGVRDVMRLAQKGRQSLAYARMPLTIFPLPARFGIRAEFRESQKWIDLFDETLSEFYLDWLPKWASPRFVLERVKIPQVDFFGFGEKLAVLEHGTSDPESMGHAYEKVADLLAKDFSNVTSWLGPKAKHYGSREKESRSIYSNLSRTSSTEYEFDIYVSHEQRSYMDEWFRDFLRLLNHFCESLTGKPLRVFYDVSEIKSGDVWSDRTKNALSRSKILMAFATHSYFKSSHRMREFHTFRHRSEVTGTNLILPIRLHGGNHYPPVIQKIQQADFRKFFTPSKHFKDTAAYYEFQKQIDLLAHDVVSLLSMVPPYDPAFSDSYLNSKLSDLDGLSLTRK